MSSILDSLKKLEKETSQQEPLPIQTVVERSTFIPKRFLGIIGGICLCVGAIGLTVYYRGFPKKMPESLPVSAAPAPKPAVVVNEPKMSLPSLPISDNATPTTTPLEAKTDKSKSPAKPVSTEPKGRKPDVGIGSEQVTVSSDIPKKEQVQETADTEPEPKRLTGEEEKSDSVGANAEKALARAKEPRSMDRLEGAGFKIQAISWSEIPAKSLAVINNQVLREGDDIEGYHISNINPDDIILQRGGKAFQLDFRSTGHP